MEKTMEAIGTLIQANAYALNLLQQHKRELEEGMADEMEKPF